MKPVILFAYVTTNALAFATRANVSQPIGADVSERSSACLDAAYNGLNIVVSETKNNITVHWPPKPSNTLNASDQYGVNCFNHVFGNVTARVCEHENFDVIHWPEELSASVDEISVNFSSMATEEAQQTPEQITDELLFKKPLKVFIIRRETKVPRYLIWESDGCTHAPDNPMGFNFLPACQRHDFGYRNYRAQNRLDKAAKKRINKQFKAEYVSFTLIVCLIVCCLWSSHDSLIH